MLPQDILGYNVELKGPGGVTLDGFYALMGCSTPLISGDRGCNKSTTYVHINVEENAYNAESINLDFYRDYNKSNQNPQNYFASPAELNVSTLLPCGDTALTSKELMSNYAEVTGDLAGVVVDEGVVVAGRCFAEYFWYAPSCRADPMTCLVWLSGGNGWGMAEFLIKASVFNMPAATAVAIDWANYVSLPTKHDVMLFWWVPDSTFLRLGTMGLQPKRIVFPDYDPDAYAKGDRRSAASGVSVDKHVSHDLSLLAPEEKEEKFLQTRENVVISCKACPSGLTFICEECPSGSFQPSGASVSCNLCPAGSYQDELGSLGCKRCPLGQYQDEEGQVSCKQCPAGATTLLLGSDSIADCGCKVGFINIGGAALECVPCGEGLECPFASSRESLNSGRGLAG
eukprot:Skav212012  [mRNA]  locus=scaffold3771:45198:48973:+ [translate_table: standard]